MIRLQEWGREVVRSGAAGLLAVVALVGLSSCSDDSRVDNAGVSPAVVDGSAQSRERDRAAREAFDHWTELLTSGGIEEARALCESWLAEPDRGHHGEAHKCLANVTIATSRAEVRGLPAAAGGAVRAPISRAGVDGALAHYDAALLIDPLDLDAHVGRVDVLIVGARYRDANLALDQSLTTFATRELLDNWFKLLGRFQRANAAPEALAFLLVIEKHHPLDHRVVSNLGAYYAINGQQDEAFAYSTRAVAINPDDPINKWNLAKIHDQRDELEDADRLYQEALATINEGDMRARCEYAGFVALRMNEPARACEFSESQCPELYEANCVSSENEERP